MIDQLLLWAHGDAPVTLDLDPWRTLAGAAVRFLQAVLEGSPYLLCGVVLAGLLPGVVGAEVIRRRWGSPSLQGVATATILGFLLPLGALGALPVARRLNAIGIPRGTTLAFLISASVLDPLSLVFGLSLLSPRPVLFYVTAVFAWSILAGFLANRVASQYFTSNSNADLETLPSSPLTRLVRAVSNMAADCSGSALRDLALAALGAGLLGACVPSGWLEQAASPSQPLANLTTAAVGALASETPLSAMRQAGSLVRDGFTYQVAFLLIALGAGLNLAVLIWLSRGLKLKSWLMVAVIGIGFLSPTLLGSILDHSGSESVRRSSFHTHAFDDVGRPHFGELNLFQIGPITWGIAAKNLETTVPAMTPLGVLTMFGLLARRPRIRSALSHWLERLDSPRERSTTRVWERSLPPRLTAALGLVAAIPALFAVILTYYPAPTVLFSDMVLVHTEVQYSVRQGNLDEALEWIERWDDLIQKLGPSLILRQGSLRAPARGKLDELREAVAALRGFLEEGRLEEARTILGHVDHAQKQCRQAFPPET